jgi:hypothetical protein
MGFARRCALSNMGVFPGSSVQRSNTTFKNEVRATSASSLNVSRAIRVHDP